jgi:hypothetical protein
MLAEERIKGLEALRLRTEEGAIVVAHVVSAKNLQIGIRAKER